MKYILLRLWKNLFSRGIFFFFLTSAVFITIYNSRYRINNFFQYLSIGPIYDDLTTWPKMPYGFREAPSKALELYKDGLYELAEKVIDVYSLDKPKQLLQSNISPNVSWQNHIHPILLKSTLTLIQNIQVFCEEPVVRSSIYQKWNRNKEIKENISQRNQNTPPIDSKNVGELRKWLILLDKKYFYASFQKKPDQYSVVTLRESIFQASCQPLRIIGLWYKSVDYLEYKAEQDIYSTEMEDDILVFTAQKNLRNNERYLKFRDQFFSRSFPAMKSLTSRIKVSWKNFIVRQDTQSLNQYCEAMLDQCRNSGPRECRLIYQSLYKLQFKGVTSNPVYLYALAETAFWSKEYYLSKRLLNEILLMKEIDPLYHKQAERLMDTILISHP